MILGSAVDLSSTDVHFQDTQLIHGSAAMAGSTFEYAQDFLASFSPLHAKNDSTFVAGSLMFFSYCAATTIVG